MDVIFDNLGKWFRQLLYKPPPPPASVKNKIITVTLLVSVVLYIYNYWSKSNEDRCWRCNRPNLVLINNECENCLNRRRDLVAQSQHHLQLITHRTVEERCQHCKLTNLVLINKICESCRERRLYRTAQTQSRIQPKTQYQIQPKTQRERIRPLFGQYKCSCGRRWASRRSWQGRYQICKECRKEVYAHTQRELLPTDVSRDRENFKDHQEDLCQMCKEIGYYCGKFRD